MDVPCEADKAMQNDVDQFLQLRQGKSNGLIRTVQVFRQGDPLLCDRFNFLMESVLRNAGVHRHGTIFQQNVQLLAYANDIDNIGRSKRDATAAFSAIDRESTKMGLAVTEGITKCILKSKYSLKQFETLLLLTPYFIIKFITNHNSMIWHKH